MVFSDGFDSLSAVQIDDVVNRAARNGVHVHTVMIGPEQEARRQNLRRIADNTGGSYRVYDSLATMEALWNEIAAERGQYRISYRMTKARPAELGVSVTRRGGQTVADAISFPVVPALAPAIEVVEPAANSLVQRIAGAPDSLLADLEPRTIPVQVAVSWPDGHPRKITRYEFELGGRTEALTGDALDGTFAFPMDSFDSGNYTLRVYATDELGLESRSLPVSLRVETDYPTPEPPTPTPEPPTPTAVPGEEPEEAEEPPVAGGFAGGSEGPAAENEAGGNAPSSSTATTGGNESQLLFTIPGINMPVARARSEQGWGALIIGNRSVQLTPVNLGIALFPLLLLLALAAYLLMQQRRPAEDALSQYAPYNTQTLASESTVVEVTAYELTEDATEPQVMPNFIAPASLIYEEGGDHLPERLDIEGGREVRIGRKQTYCDVIIDDPRISRLHASIIEKADGGFYIKDEGSSGGTFVNRRKLRVNDEYPLKTGDIVNFNTVAYCFVLNEDPRDEAAASARGADPANAPPA